MSEVHPDGEPFLFHGSSGTACLLIHGLTSAPQEMRGLGSYLAGLGHTALGIRLPGHATEPGDLTDVRWEDWVDEADRGLEELRRDHDRAIPMGLSLGGALSLLVAGTRLVSGVVAMSTPYDVPARRALRPLEIVGRFLRYVPKPPPIDFHDKRAGRSKLTYRVIPVKSITETAQMLTEMRSALPSVQVPALVMHARQDRGIAPRNAQAIYDDLGSEEKKLVWLENSGHTVTLDLAKERVFELAGEFVSQVTEPV